MSFDFAQLWLIPLNLVFTLVSVVVFFYVERKGSAFIQDRLGPTHVGKAGLLQPVADLLKLIQKETIIPDQASKKLFLLAPILVFALVFAGFSMLPVWDGWLENPGWEGGILILLGLISLEALGLLMAGYASQSKFPWIATGRAMAQMLSYEVPMGISVLCFVWIFNSLDFRVFSAEISSIHSLSPLRLPWNFTSLGVEKWGGIFQWNILRFPVLTLLVPGFFISILAESNRAPFDIPEGESEIIGGFHTEYSGFLWAIFFLAEYAMMLILSLVFTYLFLGGPLSPFPFMAWLPFLSNAGIHWLVLKSWMLCFVMIWIRWTLPRLRIDQLMGLCWKILTPISLLVLFLCVILK